MTDQSEKGGRRTLRIALAADHAGLPLKAKVAAHLADRDVVLDDLGTHGPDSVDYPDFGRALADHVVAGHADFGIAICGSGIGISIAANRVPGARAALVNQPEAAALARQHNDANILALGARLTEDGAALACVDQFLEAAFEGGRHARRVEKLG